MKEQLKSSFNFLVSLVSLASGIATVIGAVYVVPMVVEVQPIVYDMQQRLDTMVVVRPDTVVVERIDTVVITKTERVYVPQPSATPSRAASEEKKTETAPVYVSEEEEQKIRNDERSFRERHPEVFSKKRK